MNRPLDVFDFVFAGIFECDVKLALDLIGGRNPNRLAPKPAWGFPLEADK